MLPRGRPTGAVMHRTKGSPSLGRRQLRKLPPLRAATLTSVSSGSGLRGTRVLGPVAKIGRGDLALDIKWLRGPAVHVVPGLIMRAGGGQLAPEEISATRCSLAGRVVRILIFLEEPRSAWPSRSGRGLVALRFLAHS